jgi:hypothetical protein
VPVIATLEKTASHAKAGLVAVRIGTSWKTNKIERIDLVTLKGIPSFALL